MPKFKSIVGFQRGRLLVKEYKGHQKYLCLCDCGTEKIISASNLKFGNVNSCGCLKKENNSIRFTKDLIGNKYGYLTVKKVLPSTGGSKSRSWVCECICGAKKIVNSSDLKNNGVKSCGCKTKEMISRSKLDKKNPNWSGDLYGYAAVHDWVRRRKERSARCELCKKKTKRLELANISQEYKRDIHDFEWLCRQCHMKKDGRLQNLNPYSRCLGNYEPRTKEQIKAQGKAYRQTERYKTRIRAYQQTSKYKTYRKKIEQDTQRKAYIKAYMKAYYKAHQQKNENIMLEELTDKQRNMICYNLDYVFPEYLPFEYKDKLMHIIYNVKMETMDGCEMVGEIFNISKDEREMVTKKDKLVCASELKRLIDKYSDYK